MLPGKSSEIWLPARHLNFTVEMKFGSTNYENFKLPGRSSNFCVSSWHMNSSLVTWKLQSRNFKVPGKLSEFWGFTSTNVEKSTSCLVVEFTFSTAKFKVKFACQAAEFAFTTIYIGFRGELKIHCLAREMLHWTVKFQVQIMLPAKCNEFCGLTSQK